jgi:hypothetical protein
MGCSMFLTSGTDIGLLVTAAISIVQGCLPRGEGQLPVVHPVPYIGHHLMVGPVQVFYAAVW